MIPDAMFCSAAAKSCEIYATELQSGYDTDKQHVFSLAFEKKIRKLKRKADHPFFYRTAQRVASVLLALLICASAWLAIDVEARAAVFGWIKEVYESFFVYRYDENADIVAGPAVYQMVWLPDGYSELLTDNTEQTVVVIYTNKAGQMLTFSYVHNPDSTDWLIDSTDLEKRQVSVNGLPADLLLSNNPNISSVILWNLPDNTAFYISAFLNEDELIKASESVEKTNN